MSLPVLIKKTLTAQYWSALGNGIGYLNTVQISEGTVDGYDGPITGPPVASLCMYNGELYAAGYFDFVDGPVNNIVKWNGTNWSQLEPELIMLGRNYLG